MKYRVEHFQKFCSSNQNNKPNIYCVSDYDISTEGLKCIVDGLGNERCPKRLELYLNVVDIEDIGILVSMLRRKAYPIDLVLTFKLKGSEIDCDTIKNVSDLLQSVGSDIKLNLYIENIFINGVEPLLKMLADKMFSYPKNIKLYISNNSNETIPENFIGLLNAAFANPSCPLLLNFSFNKIYFDENEKEMFRSKILPGPHSWKVDIDKKKYFSITLISCQFVLTLEQLASQQVVKLLKQGEITVLGKHLETLEENIEPVNLTFRGKNDPVLPQGMISTSTSYQMGLLIFSKRHISQTQRKTDINSRFKRVVKGLKCF